MKICIIIPARGGSKGIPQKNIKFLVGKPLIYYAIKNAQSIENADIFVSSDDDAILHIAAIYKAKTLKRDAFYDDKATLDEVIHYEMHRIQKKYDIVITLQPTSPLLKASTLQNAIKYFIDNNLTSLVSATQRRHLFWKSDGESFQKLYNERVNRQSLEPLYEENGAFIICRYEYLMHNKTRISPDVFIYPIDDEEAVDIDTLNDFVLAESILKRRNIAFVVNGSTEIGMGHIYRAITLSHHFLNDNVTFFSQKKHKLGIQKLKKMNYDVVVYEEMKELINTLHLYKIDIVINDILDTDIEYMKQIKSDFFVVNFEDTSEGTHYADLVFNALYEWSGVAEDYFFGYKYEVLREDIFLYPISKVNKQLKKILVSFGGTDINNASLKILEFLFDLDQKIEIDLILGIGYAYKQELEKFLKNHQRKNINIIEDVKFMADFIDRADLVICGNGRMVYEVVAMAKPLIVVSQNEREMTHIFPKISQGIVYLGYFEQLNKTELLEKVYMFFEYEYRKKMQQLLVPYAQEIRKGTNKIVNLVNERYYEYR